MSFTIPFASGFNVDLFILVFMRMSGAVIFNPILGRTNVPMLLRATIGLLLAFIVTPTLTGVSVHIGGVVQLMVASFAELFVGFALGTLIGIVIYIVQLAGELIDMQMGITMAQMYDPHAGINMPVLGSFFNIIMMVAFFSSDAHLALISMVNDSFHLIAPGNVFPTAQSSQFMVSLLKDYFDLGLRMAVPIIAAEVVCEMALGMLMRAVPAINIFSVGMHLKALIGIVLVLVMTSVIVAMCGQLVSYLLEKAAIYIRLLGGT